MAKRKREDDFQLELSPENLSKFKALYQGNTPYNHAVINPLFNTDLLHNVIKELNTLNFTEKETDIYKVNQTGDLANLDKLSSKDSTKLQSLIRLKDAIYSQEFRDFIGEIVGITNISTSKIDLSVNRYEKSCHLLNHDDVIGDRCISFILYLPECDWVQEDGGCLELYPIIANATPGNEPTKSLVPTFNTFAFFKVEPGKSFHAVEEVVADKTRISIQGWYHYDVVEGVEELDVKHETVAKSTLQQLLSAEFSKFEYYNEDVVEYKDGEEDVVVLDKSDVEYLKKYINPVYLNAQTMGQVNDQFCNESQIQLTNFLNSSVQAKIKDLITLQDQQELKKGMTPHGTGVGNGWVCNGPPHLQRYLSAVDAQDSNTLSKELLEISQCFKSPAFKKWLTLLTTFDLKAYKSTVRRFRRGLDYTLALSNKVQVIHSNLCLTPTSESHRELWESGQVGGYMCYMMPHESMDAAVYSAQVDDGILSSTSAGWNELLIVLRDEDVLEFVKYVSAGAPGSRWDIDSQYLLSE